MTRLRVALLGSRGIPARYGGYETLMEELAARLAERGAQVTVYCRSHSTPRGLISYRGARLVTLPTVRHKYLDTPVHTLLAAWHAARQRFDVALVVNSANAIFVPLLTLAGVPTALHVDGIEHRRAKWGAFGRAVYAMSERLATLVSTTVVTDAEVIRRHYEEKYGCSSIAIAYGVDPDPMPPGETLARLELEPHRYLLYVSRFERENNPHRVVEAYRALATDTPLVMVGGAPYADRFIASFSDLGDSRIHFPGPIYGVGYRELLTSALAYIHATEVGGTHPALVEAMGYGACPLVNDTPENREVAGNTALYFQARRPESLTRLFRQVLDHPRDAIARGADARRRALVRYSWNEVVLSYERLFDTLAEKRATAPASSNADLPHLTPN